MSETRPISQVRRDLDEVKSLVASRGWAVMREALARDIELATLALAGKPSMDPAEVHYRRGALNAALSMSRLPEAVLARLDTELALHPDQLKMAGSNPQKPLKPATAGKTG